MVAVPSLTPVMVTICGMEKLEWVKVRVAGSTVAMLVSLLVMARVKLPVALRIAFRVSATAYVVVSPVLCTFADVLLRYSAGMP